jgi:enamine deaminase RidA (YjgF/YER057c/UK114 family)
MTRRSINVDSFRHSNPIPAASRIGPFIASSVIVGRDPGEDSIPDDVDAQLANLFHHVGQMLEAAGAEWRHVVKMTFYVPDLSYRNAINTPWQQHFPDLDSLPARHTQLAAGTSIVQCDFLAFVDD